MRVKKCVSLFIAVLMCITMISFGGCSEKSSQGLEFKSNGDKTCTLVGMGYCEDEHIVVPSKSPDGDKVTKIGANAFDKSKIRSIQMSNSIVEIEEEAFYQCNRLETVEFSDNLKKIGSYAFAYCDLITEIKLPDSFEEFGETAGLDSKPTNVSCTFRGCKNLSKINIPKKVKVLYANIFEGTAIQDVTVDAVFKYGYIDVRFNDNEVRVNEPRLFSEYPTEDNFHMFNESSIKNIIELDDSYNSIFYINIFGENAKVNGDAQVITASECPIGIYGDKDSYDAINILSANTLTNMRWNYTYGRYDEYGDAVYDFSYNGSLNCYDVTKDGQLKARFLIIGKTMYSSFSSTPFVYGQMHED